MTPRALLLLASALAVSPDGISESALGDPHIFNDAMAKEAAEDAEAVPGRGRDKPDENHLRNAFRVLQTPRERGEFAHHVHHTPFRHSYSAEQLAREMTEMEKLNPPAGSPRRKVLDDLEQLNYIQEVNGRHMRVLKKEKDHIDAELKNEDADMAQDESLIAKGTEHLDHVANTVASIAQSQIEEGMARHPAPLTGPAEAQPGPLQAFTGGSARAPHGPRAPDEDLPPAEIMDLDKDEPSFLQVSDAEDSGEEGLNDEERRKLHEDVTNLKERLQDDVEGHPDAGTPLVPNGAFRGQEQLDHDELHKWHLEALEHPPVIPTVPPYKALPHFLTPEEDQAVRQRRQRAARFDVLRQDRDPSSFAQEELQLQRANVEFRRRRLPPQFAIKRGTQVDTSQGVWNWTGDEKEYRQILRKTVDDVEKGVNKVQEKTKEMKEGQKVYSKGFDEYNDVRKDGRRTLKHNNRENRKQRKAIGNRRRSSLRSVVKNIKRARGLRG